MTLLQHAKQELIERIKSDWRANSIDMPTLTDFDYARMADIAFEHARNFYLPVGPDLRLIKP